MRLIPRSPNPIDIARESLQMDKDTGDKTFRMMALAMMVITAAATGVHALHSVWRDVRGRREGREYGHDDRRSFRPADDAEYRPAERQDEPDRERNWSRREERRGRLSEDEQGWTDYSRQHRHGRER